MEKIVIASNNPGKLREFAALLRPFDFDAVPQSALGVTEADEPYETEKKFMNFSRMKSLTRLLWW